MNIDLVGSTLEKLYLSNGSSIHSIEKYEEPEETETDKDMSELDSLDKDLDSSELEGVEKDLEGIDW